MTIADEAIVLVGGFGTRLRSEVPDLPKPLAPVAGRPFLAYVLDNLAEGGIRRVILATGYLAERVEQAIGSRWQGMDVVYSREPEPLGTGGALALAARQLHGQAVHMSNGDTYLRYSPQQLQQHAEREQVSLAVALAKVEDVGRYGAVELAHGRVAAFNEKGGHGPGFINAGSYFLGPGALSSLPDKPVFSFETDVLLPRAASEGLAACVDTADFIDIGVPEDYRRAQHIFAGGKP
ncbi:nucleotidyltransferase family protein [Stenotrophomonas lactitubi]|jgi:D-glycero-alpha-D-manno-heptose 1-phosphate guanylyltransferase|uniref:nucleotidyltransferase family protein n=1 Tax=Stenotrophomonas TaxID=40323 RepID=UPI002249724E|nr:nucleotidyltransferase family protein [Stenotrophomonas lactitubi]MCX2893841.1 nucleotidyltransferase family protein [Stenotrophomonas lactitubi]